MADEVGREPAKGKSEAKEVSLRRVYALPAEMVDRIVEFQAEKGFGSEVEAVRKLLDDALKSRDTANRIVSRFLSKLRSLRLTSEAAKEVLVGHPQITSIKFGPDLVEFETKDGMRVRVGDEAFLAMWDKDDNELYWIPNDPSDEFSPGRISPVAPKRRPTAPAFDKDDDDIPF